MPKRRAPSDEDEIGGNAHQSASEEEVAKKSKKSTTKSEKPKPSKKQKKGKEITTEDGEVKTNDEGEQYVDLGRNRRVTVNVFKGIPLIDIREYFGKDQKPGKKGISLKLEEWQALKLNMDAIDGILSNVKTKD